MSEASLGVARGEVQINVADAHKSMLTIIKDVEKLAAAAPKVNAAFKGFGSVPSLSGLQSDLTKTGLGLNNLARNATLAGVAMKTDIAAGVTSASTRLDTFQGGLSKTSDLLGKMALPMVAAGVAAGSLGIAFDKNLRAINSIAGLTEEQLGDLGQSFIDLSRDQTKTNEGARALAAGFYEIQSSGFAGADGMKVLEASTLAASAGMTETAISSKAISAILNAYGESASDAAHVSDILFQTVNAGVVSFPELAGSIGKVIPTAAQAKISLEEIGAGIATLTKSGLSGSEAVSSLNALISSIIKPSQEAADLAHKLGLEWNLSSLQAKGFTQFMQDLNTATGGSAEQIAILTGTQEGLRAALGIGKGDMKGFTADLDGMKNSAGAAQRAFDEMSKSTAAQFQRAKANFEAVGIQLASNILPRVNDVLEGINDLAVAFSKLPEGQQQKYIDIALGLAGVTTALFAVTKAAQGTVAALGAVKLIGSGLTALAGGPVVLALAGFASILYGISLATKDTGTNYKGMADAVNSSNPVIQEAYRLLYGTESGGGGSSWVAEAGLTAVDTKAKIDELKASLVELLKVQLEQAALAESRKGQGGGPRARPGGVSPAEANALAETNRQIAEYTKQIRELEAIQARQADTGSRQATSFANTGSAYQTMTQAMVASSPAAAAALRAVLDPEVAAKLREELASSEATIGQVFGNILSTQDAFYATREEGESAHLTEMQRLQEDYGTKRAELEVALKGDLTQAQRETLNAQLSELDAGYELQRQEAEAGYAKQEAAQNLSLARQEAELRKSLGRQIIEWIKAQAALNPDDQALQERARRSVAIVGHEYGILPTIAEQTATKITDFFAAALNDPNISESEIAKELQRIKEDGDAAQLTFNSIRGIYEAEIRTNAEATGEDIDVTAEKLSKLDQRVQITIDSNTGIIGQEFDTLDQLADAITRERTLTIHTEADTGEARGSIAETQVQADALDQTTPNILVTTDAPLSTKAIEETSTALDLLDRHAPATTEVTTNAATSTQAIEDTTTALDVLDRHGPVAVSVTTNAGSVAAALDAANSALSRLAQRAATPTTVTIRANIAGSIHAQSPSPMEESLARTADLIRAMPTLHLRAEGDNEILRVLDISHLTGGYARAPRTLGAGLADALVGGFVDQKPMESIADKIKTMLNQTIPADAVPFAGRLGGNLGAALYGGFVDQKPIESIGDKIKTMLNQTIPADAVPYAGTLGGNLGKTIGEAMIAGITEKAPNLNEALAGAVATSMGAGQGAITSATPGIVEAIRSLVDQYNAEIVRIKAPDFKIGYDRGAPWTPQAPPVIPPAFFATTPMLPQRYQAASLSGGTQQPSTGATDNSIRIDSLTIVAQPGQDTRQLAKDVMYEIDKENRLRRTR